MTSKLETKRDIQELLDKLVAAQKEVVYAYSSGHLNENNLFKPQPPPPSQPFKWATSQHKAHDKHRPPSAQSSDSTEVLNAVTNFALSLDHGGVSNDPVTNREWREGQEKPKKVKNPRATSSLGTPRRTLSKVQRESAKVLPKHLESITKTEEYLKLKSFECNVLEKEKMLRRDFGSGKELVGAIEDKLDADLQLQDGWQLGQGFLRLEAHSSAFDQLSGSSQTFGPTLKKIKRVYDDYISFLLDTDVSKHRILHGQLMQLTDMHSTNSAAIKKEAQTLAELEKRGKLVLQENGRLWAELKKEKERANQSPSEHPKTAVPRHERPEPSEQIEKLNGSICDVADSTKQLRDTLRRECVPTTVCTYLRHCIKEADVDVQRMTSQKEYYERSISELTADLRAAIESADTTDRDAKKIWKKLETLTKQILPGGGSGGIRAGGNMVEPHTDDEDDSEKWNWYIS